MHMQPHPNHLRRVSQAHTEANSYQQEKSIDSHYVEQRILDDISATTHSPLRISAKYMRSKGVTYIIATIYLWHSEGFSEWNNLLLLQLHLLAKLTGCPLIIYGDFNIHRDKFIESGWLEFLEVELFSPDTPSTLSTTGDSLIDYVLVSRSISSIVLSITHTWDITWGPHAGLILELESRPRITHGLVQCKPKAFPLSDFISSWEQLSPNAQQYAYNDAYSKAHTTLQAQKDKTGIAILGKPLSTLDSDIKFQGKLKEESLAAGENIALAALTAEYLVCQVAGIPESKWNKYIGRSQYPKFKNKQLISKSVERDTCPHVRYWGAIKSSLGALKNMLPLPVPMTQQTETLLSSLVSLLEFVDRHCMGLSSEFEALAGAIGPSLKYADRSVGQSLLDHAASIF